MGTAALCPALPRAAQGLARRSGGALPRRVPQRQRPAPARPGPRGCPAGQRRGAVREAGRLPVPAAGAAGIPGGGGHVPAAVRALGTPAAAVLPGEVPVHGAPGARPARRAWARCRRRGRGAGPGPAGAALANGGAALASGGAWRRPGPGCQCRTPLAQPLDSIPAAGRSNQCSAWLGTHACIPFWMTNHGKGRGGGNKIRQPTKTTLAIFRKI